MGVFYQGTITPDSSGNGTNAKKIISWLVEKAGLEIVETVTDTTSTYKVYARPFGTSDVFFELYNSNSKLYIQTVGYSGSGSLSVNGVSGYTNHNRYSNSITITSNITYNVYACVTDSVVMIGVNKTADALVKLTEMCSGQTVYGGGYFTTSGAVPFADLSCIFEGNPTDLSDLPRLAMEGQVENSNGYVRARPIVFYCTNYNFIGLLANPADLCCIVSAGSVLSNSLWTEYNIAGHRFIGTGYGGRFIKIS